MGDCTPETWSLKQIKDSLEKEWNGKKKIVIPMFQRGKRWDKNRKETFIDSLRKKYPIGTLLFYKTVEGTQEIYTLIDGLQRGTAIKDYLSSPSKFFNLSDLREESLNQVYDLIIVNGSRESQIEKINQIIMDYIHSLKTYEDLELLELFNNLTSEFPLLGTKSKQFCDALKDDFKSLKENYNSLSNMQIPAIVYTGDENTLPEIFERINSKGVALDEYEIYAASWPRKEFSISNEGIVGYVLKKYDTLNDSEYAIKGYDREAKRISKSVNAFEYVFGLSKYIQNQYSSFNFYRNKKDDETNPVAFQLLNACFNSSHGQIKDVHKIITRFIDNIDVLESALFSSIEFVNKCIEPILKFKGNNRKDEGKIFHSQYQIMSLVSFVFRKKYDIEDSRLKVLDTWRDSKQKLMSNIWKYYVYDILTRYWSEGGTGKIHSANNDNRYFEEITQGQFSTAYDGYTEGMYNIHEKKQVSNPSDIDYVLLNAIYVNSFTAMDQLSIDKFDVEHIATKDQMKKLNAVVDGWGLPISHFANLCYLPEYENRSKGSNNFYQDLNYLNNSNLTLEEIENKYSFTTKDDLEFMNLPYDSGDFDALQNYYIDFLRKRNLILKKKLLQSIGFSDDEQLNENDNNVSYEMFDDKYFRITKIGKMVSETIKYFFENNLLSDSDIFNLKDREFSSKTGCHMSILICDKNMIKDVNGRLRYYVDPIQKDGIDYYICKEWYEESRTKFVNWAKSILAKNN
ncbi:MAG: DUF262 domain-containing protein [Acholeplasmatales bacterium]|nr:DUF262 domain-containing protein [Acholeplasmatales bacterium]